MNEESLKLHADNHHPLSEANSRPKFVSTDDIKQAVKVSDLISPLEKAMVAVSEKTATIPIRQVMPINDLGKFGVMYGALPEPPVHGAKLLSLFPGAPALGLSSHQGSFALFDSNTGSPLATFDADVLTAIRTAAMTMLSTKTLARPTPQIITICGAGEQAEWHVKGFFEVFDQAKIRIWARNGERARKLIASFPGQAERLEFIPTLETAIKGADVVTTLTSSTTAFLPGDLLEPGQHVNLVGASRADAREIDNAGVARLNLFTDALASSKIESGEVIDARQNGIIGPDYEIVEIGEVLAGRHPGRAFESQITAYKSHGLIVQDLAAAHEIFQRLFCNHG